MTAMSRPEKIGWVIYPSEALAIRERDAIDLAAKDYLDNAPTYRMTNGVVVATYLPGHPMHNKTKHLTSVHKEPGSNRHALLVTRKHPDGGPPGVEGFHGVTVDLLPDAAQHSIDVRTNLVTHLADAGWSTEGSE